MKPDESGISMNVGARLKRIFMLNFARNNIFVLIDQGVVSVANFLTTLVIGRTCTKEEFGLYMLGFSIVIFAMNVQGFLISTPYTIHSPHLKEDDLARYSGSTLVHQLSFSMLVVFFLTIFAILLFFGFGPPGLFAIIRTLIFAISLILLWDYVRRLCLAALRTKTTLYLDCSVMVMQVGGIFLLNVLNLLSASRAFLVIGVSCGFSSLFWLFSKRKEFVVGFTQIISHLKYNMATGLWIFASGLLWSVGTSIYPWLLASFHGPASTGVWAACLSVVNLYNPIFMALQNSLGPKIAHAHARGDSEALYRFSLQTAKVCGIAVLPFSIAFLFSGGALLTLLYGDKYMGSGLIVSILGLNLLIVSLAFSPSRTIITLGHADVDFKINLFMLVGLLSYGIWLVKSFGAIGAAIGLLITNSVCLIFRYVSFFRIIRSQQRKSALGPKSIFSTLSPRDL